MLCDVCGKKEAKIYYTEIIGGKKKEQHLCEDCAMDQSSFKLLNSSNPNEVSLGGMLFGILDSIGKKESGKETPITKCKSCGLRYEEFRKLGKFGCADCYTSFGKILNENLRSIHGADMHTGKRPKGYESPTEKIINQLPELDKLAMQLQRAIEQEEYEEAAKLRDRIRALKENEEKESTKN